MCFYGEYGWYFPTDTIPAFDVLYCDRLGHVNDFEAVTFYSDFTWLTNSRLMTPFMQQQLIGYFQSSFVTDIDPSIDLMCAEAFQLTHGVKKSNITPSFPAKPKKCAKNYSTPPVCT